MRLRNSRIGGRAVSVGTTVARIAIASFGRLSVPMTTASARASHRWVARHAKTRVRPEQPDHTAAEQVQDHEPEEQFERQQHQRPEEEEEEGGDQEREGEQDNRNQPDEE